MSQPSLTPEQVICQMSVTDLQELLEDLRMESSVATAIHLKRLVRELGNFEEAVDCIQGPAVMRRSSAA